MEIEKVASELRKPNILYIMYDDLGRDILAKASKTQSSVFYVYGKDGMGKTTMAFWLKDVARIYGFTARYIDAKKVTSTAQLRDLLKTRKEGFLYWFSMMFMKRHTRLFIIVDDAHRIGEKRILNFMLKLLDIPFLWVSVCLLSSVPLEEYEYKDLLLDRSVYYVKLVKPSKNKIVEVLRRRLSALGIKPSLEMLITIIDRNETIRDIIEDIIRELSKTK